MVFDGTNQKAADVIRHRAEALGVSAYEIQKVEYKACTLADEAESKGGGALGILIRRPFCGNITEFEIPFPAPYQAMNAALAVQAFECFLTQWQKYGKPEGPFVPMPDSGVVRLGIRRTVWPARMEEVLPGVFLDGAHNDDGIRALIQAASLIKEVRRPERIWLLFAVSSDKDYRQMLKRLAKDLNPEFCLFTRMDSGRALSEETLTADAGELFGDESVRMTFSTVNQAFSYLKGHVTERDLAFVTGSLYLAGELKGEIADD